MIESLHHGTTWAWIIIAFVLGVVLPRVLNWLAHAGSQAVAYITYYGGRLVLLAIVVGGLYLGAKAVAG